MNCQYCDYYNELKNKAGDRNAYVCQFTNYIFAADADAMDIEYPCTNVSFQDYVKANSQKIVAKKDFIPVVETAAMEKRVI